jgi:hypothetical protein
MNLLNKLDTELKGRHLSDFEKVRYIYLRTCELFSFDGKYFFPKSFSMEEYEEILNKKIDVTNVTDYLVVCHSYSKLLATLIRKLTSAEVELHGSIHSFVYYKQRPGLVWTMDATNGDLSRVKMELKPSGFYNNKTNFDKELTEIDKELGFIYKPKEYYLKMLNRDSLDGLFISLNNMLINSRCKNEYNDALYFVKWLLIQIMCPLNEACGIDNEHNFYHFFAGDDCLYYLSANEGIYNIQKIASEDAIKLTRKIHVSNNTIGIK